MDDVRRRSERVPSLIDEAAKNEVSDFPRFVELVQELLMKAGEMEARTISALVKKLKAD